MMNGERRGRDSRSTVQDTGRVSAQNISEMHENLYGRLFPTWELSWNLRNKNGYWSLQAISRSEISPLDTYFSSPMFKHFPERFGFPLL
jgi:hypothetical protein